MPVLGYGTWLANDAEKLKTALRKALDEGYRYIDTAEFYKNEKIIGEVLQEYYDTGKLKRSDIFICTKLPFYGHRQADDFIANSLKTLRTNYIDLYLIHFPFPMKSVAKGKDKSVFLNETFVHDLIPLIETWRKLERYYRAGVFKAIGVSNFNVKQLQNLYDDSEIKPHNLQNELIALCKKLKISMISFGTLGSPGSVSERSGVRADCLGHPLVLEMARKYHKTPAQILLRQMIQRGVTVIPKSLTPSRMVENFNVFDFEIKAKDMKRFEKEIKQFTRLFGFFAVNNVTKHPWYPFDDVKHMF